MSKEWKPGQESIRTIPTPQRITKDSFPNVSTLDISIKIEEDRWEIKLIDKLINIAEKDGFSNVVHLPHLITMRFSDLDICVFNVDVPSLIINLDSRIEIRGYQEIIELFNILNYKRKIDDSRKSTRLNVDNLSVKDVIGKILKELNKNIRGQ